MTFRRFLDEAQRIIGIHSISGQGNEELVNYLAFLVQNRGLNVNLQRVIHSIEDVSRRQFNLVGILGDPLVDRKIRKGLLLLTHLDTAAPGLKEHWTETGGEPFRATEKSDLLYGLGTANAKLDFLCKLYAVQKFKDEKLKMPVYLVGTCGEEIGMFGCKFLIQSLALNPRYVMVGAPTDLKIAPAHKSVNVFRVSVEYQIVERGARGFNRRVNLRCLGRAAHSAFPEASQNALYDLVDFLRLAFDNGFEIQFTRIESGGAVNQIPDLAETELYLTSHQLEDFKRFFKEALRTSGRAQNFQMELGGIGDVGISFLPEEVFPCLNEILNFPKTLISRFQNQHSEAFDQSEVSVNVGFVRQNRSTTEVSFEVRLLPEHDPGELQNHVFQAISQLSARFPNLNLRVSRERVSPPLLMAEDSPWVGLCGSAMEEAGLMPNLGPISLATEAGHFFKKGFDAVAFGPGRVEDGVHGPNEFVKIADLQAAIAFYEKLIEKTCL